MHRSVGFVWTRAAFRAGAGALAGAAGLILAGAGGAAGADLPPAPPAVDYVRVCGAAGEGYYYLPGTETCVRLAGEIDIDYIVNWSSGDAEARWRSDDSSNLYVKSKLYAYSYTDTDFGPLTTTFEFYAVNDVDEDNELGVDYAFIQWGGFTFGRNESVFDAANYTTWAEVYTPAMSDTKINQASYTATFSERFSATVSVEDAATRQLGIALYPYMGLPAAGRIYPDQIAFAGDDGYGGTKWPDAVGRLKTTGAWGSAQVTAAAHQVYAAYNDAAGSDGVTPSGGVGWAVAGAFTADLPHGVMLVGTGAYARGAASYVHSSWYSLPVQGTLAYDAAYDPASGDLDLTTAYSLSFGTAFDVGPAQFAVQTGWSRFEDGTIARVTGGASSADFSQIDVQAQIGFEPVKDLIIGFGTEYQYLDHDDAAIGDAQHMSTYLHVDRTF